jgi:hypothetical protein
MVLGCDEMHVTHGLTTLDAPKEVPKEVLLLLLFDGLMLAAKSMSITVNNPTEVAICNSSPYFRNIADMRIKCENADLRLRICGCGPSELDSALSQLLAGSIFGSVGTSSPLLMRRWIRIRKLYRFGSKINVKIISNPEPNWKLHPTLSSDPNPLN